MLNVKRHAELRRALWSLKIEYEAGGEVDLGGWIETLLLLSHPEAMDSLDEAIRSMRGDLDKE